MEYNYSRVYSRKDKSVEFYKDDPAFLEYVQATYIANNQCKTFREQRFVDADQLVLEIKTVWLSEEGIEAARIDPAFTRNEAKRSEHNRINCIPLLSIVEY